jgi:hypothetical protein
MFPRSVGAALILLLVTICGCESVPEDSGMTGASYLNPRKDLHRLGRVALVELDNMSNFPEIGTDATNALYLAMQKKQAFSLTTISHEDPAWQSLQLNLDSLQALRGLQTMRETLRCNGLLVGTITEYRPYPHIVLGLRMKLLDLTDGQLLWAVEQIWDGGDKTIQRRIKAYFEEELRRGTAPLREDLVVISPLEFLKFAAYEVAETLERKE